MKSSIAAPSRGNYRLEAASNAKSEVAARIQRSRCRLMPMRGRRLGHHHRVTARGTRHFLCRGVGVSQIGVAIAAPRRRAHGNEDHLGTLHGCGQVLNKA